MGSKRVICVAIMMLVLSGCSSSNLFDASFYSDIEYLVQPYVTEEPLNDLPDDYIFSFECSDSANVEMYEAFRILIDDGMKESILLNYEYSTTKNRVYIKPPQYEILSLLDEVKEGSWGYANKYILVQYYDIIAGNKLFKPIVTEFTIDREISSPRLKIGKTEKELNWSPVIGATSYFIYKIEDFSQFGVWTCKPTLIAEIEDTKYKVGTYYNTMYGVAAFNKHTGEISNLSNLISSDDVEKYVESVEKAGSNRNG